MPDEAYVLTRFGASLHKRSRGSITRCGQWWVKEVRSSNSLSVAEREGWFGPETFAHYAERQAGVLCKLCHGEPRDAP